MSSPSEPNSRRARPRDALLTLKNYYDALFSLKNYYTLFYTLILCWCPQRGASSVKLWPVEAEIDNTSFKPCGVHM